MTEPIIFDRYTERSLNGGTIVIDSSLAAKQIRFNVMAARMMGLSPGLHVQFIKIGEDWFVKTTELQRGYLLQRSHGSYRVTSKIFIQEIMDDMRYHKAKVIKCRLVKTNIEHEGAALYRIDRPFKIRSDKKSSK